MRRLLPFCLMMLTAFPASGAPDYSRLEYFPAELHMSQVECQLGPKRIKLPLLSDFHDAWFSKHLAAAEEPSLFEQSLRPPQDTVASYRFTWLRSFHAPIIVRIEERRGGVMSLTAKRLSGKGGYDPGVLDGVITRPLTAKEGVDVRRAFAASDFVAFKPNPCDVATDGAQWVVEGLAGGKYRVVHQQSPQKGPVRRIGLVLLFLTNWNIGPVY
jgi:hypothetical protein